MVLGIGIDILKIARIREAIENSGQVFLDKVFTAWEQERARFHPDPIAYYAMGFAGKEAIFKCFGTSWDTGVELNQIEIREGQFGEPVPLLGGAFAKLARERGGAKVRLSLSYETEYAVGVAVLVREEVQEHEAGGKDSRRGQESGGQSLPPGCQ